MAGIVPRSRTTVGLVLAFIGVLAFSLTLPMTRLAITALTPAQVAVWRAIYAAILGALILLVIRPPLPVRQHWMYLLICGLGTVFGFPLFSALGLQTVSASQGAVVIGLLPLGTAVCGAIVGGERPSVAFWLCAGAGALLTTIYVIRQSESGIAVGHLWLLGAVVSASMGYAYGGLAARTLKGWAVSCWALVVSAPALIVLGFLVPSPSLATPWPALGAFAYLAAVSQLCGFFALYKGMAMAGIARASQVQLLQLFLTLIFAATFFGETWSHEALVFGVLVVLTVALGLRTRIGPDVP